MRRTPTAFQGAGLPRLITMVSMLVVMGMVIVSLKQASMRGTPSPNRPPRVANTGKSAAAQKTSEKNPSGEKSHAPTQVEAAESPLDEDVEQRIAAEEEFQAVSDKTMGMQREEMPAYWRVMNWAMKQPLSSLQSRSREDFKLNDLMLQPEEHRGELLQLDLHVCRVLEMDAPRNPLGLKQLYEVWGWSDESHAWLYVGICPELPAGFPIGSDVTARATLCGYFFKLQGYLEAGAAPRSAPLSAPVLIGRLDWQPQPEPTLVGSELPWVIGLAVVAGLLLTARVAWMLLRKRKSTGPVIRPGEQVLTAEQWLSGIQRAGTEGAPPANLQRTTSENE